MFGKRQRRHEDDEPLVPRGLIWQATDDTVAAETPQTEAKEPNPAVAKLKTIPPPSRIATPVSPIQLPAPKADSTSEEAPFWQKLPEVQKQTPLRREAAPPKPPQASYPLPATVNNMPRPRSYSRAALDLLKRQGIWVNEARRRFIVGAHKVSDRVDRRAVILKVRSRLDAAFKRTTTLVAQIRGDAQHGYNELKARAHSRFAARTHEARPQTQPHTNKAEPQFGPLEPLPMTRQRVRSPLLIPLPARTGAVAETVLPRLETVHALRRDSRLWASFTMAGLSALFVLGIISTAHHYAAQALPSNVLHKTSAAACAPTEAATQASHPVATRIRAAHSPNRRASTLPKRANSARVAKPRHSRRTQNDDYVAPDTFVSYDNRRGSSR
jgi:hypothetical protein